MGQRHPYRPDEDQSSTGRWVTVNEAAEALDVSVEAVRGRIKRGSITHERRGNAVYVLLESDQSSTSHDQSTTGHQPVADQWALVEALQEQVGYLRDQVESEREARRRADHIIAALTERIPELEASPQSPEEAESASENASSGEADWEEAPEEHKEPQTGARRPWWRRIFGG